MEYRHLTERRTLLEEEILTNLAKAVKEYDAAGAESWACKAMEGGI